MRNILHKSYTENQNTHFLFNNIFLKVVPLMRQCKKISYSQKGHRWHIIQPMCSVCCIPRASDTHSEYVILLFHSNNDYANAPSCYIYMYIACLSIQAYFSCYAFQLICPVDTPQITVCIYHAVFPYLRLY
jgi:hypothetical protein